MNSINSGSWNAFADFPSAFTSAIIGPDGSVWGMKGVWNATERENRKLCALEDGCLVTCGGQAFRICNRIDPRSAEEEANKSRSTSSKEKPKRENASDKKYSEQKGRQETKQQQNTQTDAADAKHKYTRESNPLDALSERVKERYEGFQPLEEVEIEQVDMAHSVWFGCKAKGQYCIVIKELSAPQCTLAAIGPAVWRGHLIFEVTQFAERIQKSVTKEAWDVMIDFKSSENSVVAGIRFGEPWGTTGTWKPSQYEIKQWIGLASGREKRGCGKLNAISEYLFKGTSTDQGVYYDEDNRNVLLVMLLKKCAILATAPIDREMELNKEMKSLASSLTKAGY